MTQPDHTTLNEISKLADNLPVLPGGVLYLLETLNDDNIPFKQLADEIEKFPSIAIKIVAIANSAWSLPESPITNLPDACSRIGLNIVRSISIALSISQIFDPTQCPAFDAKKYWTSALLNAESASICSREKTDICPNTARLAGLLHNIGLLWLANIKPLDTEAAIISHQQHPETSLAEYLFEKLNCDYYIAGGQIAKAMKLPDIMAAAISTNVSSELKSDDVFIHNHCYARQLTASVLQQPDTNESDLIKQHTDPRYHQLTALLPKVKLMAESIF